MTTNHKIIIGDSRLMPEVSDESIHLVITSPPYWQLKDYGEDQQIGFHDTYESYINNLNLVWKECFRVLHNGCRLCINIGDQFARSVYYGRYKVIPIRTEIIKFCETIGMDYMGAVIWQKVTTTNTTGGASIMGSFPYPRNGILKLDYEFILIFKKLGDPPNVSKEIKELSKLSIVEWNSYFAGHWNFPGERQQGHLAMFPEELPRRLIRMFSFVGETVLDPFLGSGTTSLAAKNLNRNSVGIEISPTFIPIIKNKLKVSQHEIFDGTAFELVTRQETEHSFDNESASLPYKFTDPHKLNTKVDPRKLKFGSKIEKDDNGDTTQLFTVKEILSPEVLKLSNGLMVKLIGVVENSTCRDDAVKFLSSKTDGQRVFLRFDTNKYDGNGNLLVYMYLKNKTFINAHIIKTGLVNLDRTANFKYKSKFIDLLETER
jgi:site-specific DNA-methyltransferase (adenine-specific)